MMLMEEEVIAGKLKKYGRIQDARTEKFISSIQPDLFDMKNNAVNTSARYIKMEKGIRGRLNWLKKKIVRRLCFFYVQPVCDQQTLYNTAAVQCIEKLLEIETGLRDRIDELDRSNHELDKSNHELQKELSDVNTKLNQCLENMKVIEETGVLRLASSTGSVSVKSYAQSGEDAIIIYIFTHLHVDVKKAFYLDLGANHAKELSNTFALYEKGMRGVLLEANPALIPELKLNRSEDVIVPKCLALQSGRPVTFYVLSGDGLSTSDKDEVEKVIEENPEITVIDEIEVETVTIQELLDQYFSGAPELLNIDLEGMELEILNSIDFAKVRPLVIIVEMIAYSTIINAGSKNQQILDKMKEKNYIEYAFTGINSIFVDASVWEHTE